MPRELAERDVEPEAARPLPELRAVERLRVAGLERLLPVPDLERLLAVPDFERLLAVPDLERLLVEPDRERLELLEDVRREAVRLRVGRAPFLRSSDGISAFATAPTSCGISFWRKLAMRSSSRRISFASFAVSLSPTEPASSSIAV